MIMPGSWSSGFKSLPSAGVGARRRNGFDVNSANAMIPALTMPSTPSTRLANSSGCERLPAATASVQIPSTVIQNNMEPS
jgi:hypothetical protein